MIRTASHIFDRAEEAFLVLLFVTLIGASAAQVAFRFLLNYPLYWTEELARLIFVLFVYIAAAVAIRANRHVRVSGLEVLIPERYIPYLYTAIDLLWFLFTLLIALYGFYDTLDKFNYGMKLPALQWPMWIPAGFIPLSFLLMALRILQQIVLRHLPRGIFG